MFVKVVVKKSDKEMCNLFLDIILFAILLIFMVLLMILPDTTQTMYYRMYYAGLSSLGVPGVPWHTQILADQLTLFQPRGTNHAHLITTGTLGFSDLPTAL